MWGTITCQTMLDHESFVDDLDAALPPLESALATVAKEARERFAITAYEPPTASAS